MRLLAFFWVLLVACPIQAAVKYVVEGADDAQQQNVQDFLTRQNLSEQDAPSFIRQRVRQQTQQALAALGYFSPTITMALHSDDDDLEVRVTIKPGEPTRISQFDFKLLGPIQSDSQLKKRLSQQKLAQGKIFNSGQYEDFKQILDSYAKANGFLDGHFVRSTVKVFAKKHQAQVFLHYQGGKQYKFGKIIFSHCEVPLRLLRNLAPFQAGDPYRSQLVTEFSQELNKTGYFKSVLVEPKGIDHQQGIVNLNVELARKSENIFGVGLGYSTDQGVKGKFKWNHPFINHYGHQFNANVSLSEVEQTVTTEYRIPVDNPVSDFYSLQTGYKKEIDNDTNSRSHLITLARQWELESDWTPQVFVKTLYEDYRQGLQNDSTLLFMPGFSLSRLRSRGPKNNPYWGDNQSLTAEFSSPKWFSDVTLTKLKAHSKWLRSYGRSRLIARATGGVIIVDHIDDVPASMRFFAGGDESIRGYSYKSISPRDDSGQLVGGKYLVSGSIEYNYQIVPKWRLATFYDTGTAANDFSQKLYAGVGVGVRWQTPIGSVRLDIAKPLVKDRDNQKWQLHFTLGPDL